MLNGYLSLYDSVASAFIVLLDNFNCKRDYKNKEKEEKKKKVKEKMKKERERNNDRKLSLCIWEGCT